MESLAVIGQYIAQFQIGFRVGLLVGQDIGQVITHFDQTFPRSLIDHALTVFENGDSGRSLAAQGCVDFLTIRLFLVGAVDLGLNGQVLVPSGAVRALRTLNILLRVGRVADVPLKREGRQGLLRIGDGSSQHQARLTRLVVVRVCVVRLEVKVTPFFDVRIVILILHVPRQVALLVVAVGVIELQCALLQGQILGQANRYCDLRLGAAVKDSQILFDIALHRDFWRYLDSYRALSVVQQVVGLADIALLHIGGGDPDACVLGGDQHRIAELVAAVAAADLVTVAVLGLLVAVFAAIRFDQRRFADVPRDFFAVFCSAGDIVICKRGCRLSVAFNQALIQQAAAALQGDAVLAQALPAGVTDERFAVEGAVGRPCAHIHCGGIAAADFADILADLHHMANGNLAPVTDAAVAHLIQHRHAGFAGGFQLSQSVVVDQTVAVRRGIKAEFIHVGGATVIAGIHLAMPQGLALVQLCVSSSRPLSIDPTIAWIAVVNRRFNILGCVQDRKIIVLCQLGGAGVPVTAAGIAELDHTDTTQLVFHIGGRPPCNRYLRIAFLVDNRLHSVRVKLHQHVKCGQVVVLGLRVGLRFVEIGVRIVGRGDGLTAKPQVAGHVQLAAHAGDIGTQFLFAFIVQHGFAVRTKLVGRLINGVAVASHRLGDVHAKGLALVVVIRVVGLVGGVFLELVQLILGEIIVVVDVVLNGRLDAVHLVCINTVHLELIRYHAQIRLQETVVALAIAKVIFVQINGDDDLQVPCTEGIGRAVHTADGFHVVAAYTEGCLSLGVLLSPTGGIFAFLVRCSHRPNAAAVVSGNVGRVLRVKGGILGQVVLIVPVHIDARLIVAGIVTGQRLAAVVGFVRPQNGGDSYSLTAILTAFLIGDLLAVVEQAAVHTYAEGYIPGGHLDAAQGFAGILIAQLQGHAVTGHHAVHNVRVGGLALIVLFLGDLNLLVNVKVADAFYIGLVINGKVVGRLGGNNHRVSVQTDLVRAGVVFVFVLVVAAVIEPCFDSRLQRFTVVHTAYRDGKLLARFRDTGCLILCQYQILISLQHHALDGGVIITQRAVERGANTLDRHIIFFAGNLDADPQALGRVGKFILHSGALDDQFNAVVCGAKAADQPVFIVAVVTGSPCQRGIGAHILGFSSVVVRHGQVFAGWSDSITLFLILQGVDFVGLSHACYSCDCGLSVLHILCGDNTVHFIEGIAAVVVAGVLPRQFQAFNIHIVAGNPGAFAAVIVCSQLYIVDIGHFGGQVFAAFRAAFRSDLVGRFVVALGKGVGVAVIAPDIVLFVLHAGGCDQIDHTVFVGGINIAAGAAVLAGNVAIQAATLEVEGTVCAAQTAAGGGLVFGDAAAIDGKCTAILIDAAACIGGIVACDVTVAHQHRTAAAQTPASATVCRVAADLAAAHQHDAAILRNAAAGMICLILGDFAVGNGHIASVEVYAGAVISGIAADLAACHIELAVIGNINRAPVLGGAVRDSGLLGQGIGAFFHINGAAASGFVVGFINKGLAGFDLCIAVLGKGAVVYIDSAAPGSLAAGNNGTLPHGQVGTAGYIGCTAVAGGAAAGKGGIGQGDIGIVAQQQCAAVSSRAADGAVFDNKGAVLNGQGRSTADALDAVLAQIQRDIGACADQRAGVGIFQQRYGQFGGRVFGQCVTGRIHGFLQAVISNRLAVVTC